MKTNSKSRIMEEMRETAQDMYECGIIDKHRLEHHKALYDAGREPEYTAARRGAYETMKRHIQAGVPMESRRDGKMVMLSPGEMEGILAEAEKE